MSTAQELDQVTFEEVPDRVDSVVDVIAGNALRAEREGRVPQENFEALAETGFMRLMAPKQYGGLESTWEINAEAIARVGAACSSTAWVSAVSLAGQWVVGCLGDDAQAEVFTDNPDAWTTCVPNGFTARARQDGDDWILSGRWPFSTGSQNVPWLGQGAIIGEEDGQPVLGYFVFPSSETTHLDDWNATGMSGTGSVTVVAEDVRIPARRMIRLDELMAQNFRSSQNDGKPLWNTTMMGMLIAGSMGTPIGMGRGAMNAFLQRLEGRIITYTHYVQAEAPVTHIALAEATAKLHAAELVGFDVATLVDRKNETGEEWTLKERAALRANGGHALTLAQDCVDLLFKNSGATGIQEHLVVQRFKRDLDALAVHALLIDQTHYELHGRILCGGDPLTAFL
jgi:alkylation response protein AidB-like acyl-CoA dehydrogenase